MSDEKYIELINKKIDGQLTTDEEQILNSYLVTHPNSGDYSKDLRRAMELLENLDELNPPPALKNNIMNAVDPALYSRNNTLKRENFSWSLLFQPAPRISLAFAAGLLIGIFMFSLYDNNYTLDNKDIYGTIGLANRNHYTVLNQIPLKNAQATGLLTIKKSTANLIADINLQNMFVGELTVEYDPAKFIFNGYESFEQSSSRLENSIGILKLTISGRNHSQLMFKEISGSSSSIKFELKTAQKVLVSKTIELSNQ